MSHEARFVLHLVAFWLVEAAAARLPEVLSLEMASLGLVAVLVAVGGWVFVAPPSLKVVVGPLAVVPLAVVPLAVGPLAVGALDVYVSGCARATVLALS